MKTKLTLLITMLITLSSIAQQGINYKALIKDGSGNVVANQSVTVQFSILKGVAQTNVYQETHTPTTDANGIVILNISTGTVDSGSYASIIWASDDHFLNVQINTGSGLVDLGTTQFMAVPYALNVTGLEALDEGNGNGWRLIGQDPLNYGAIGANATDLSYNNFASTTNGATGFATTAMGYETTASGAASTAMGYITTASGSYSTAMGSFTTASGDSSTAMGDFTIASGVNSTAMGGFSIASGLYSTAMGYATEALSIAETVIGSYNTAYTLGSNGATQWNATDRLFTVGNGTSGANSNALTILKNGTITAPSLDIAEITDNKALVTKEYFDTNSPTASTGLEALDEGNGTGWRLKGRDPSNYGAIGSNATDLSNSSVPSTTFGATGSFSIAMGWDTTASGQNSTAMGLDTTASGSWSTAMGGETTASGNWTTAMGFDATASGVVSSAMGFGTTAPSFVETAIGSNNTTYTLGTNGATQWNVTDRLFTVGNGIDSGSKSNALTILKNGNVGIGVENPLEKIHTNGKIRTDYWPTRFWETYVDNADDYNFAYNGVLKSYINDADGSYNIASDRNLKNNIQSIDTSVIEKVLQLNPVTYTYKKDKTNKLQNGFIAQEVQKLFPELVNKKNTKEGEFLTLRYDAFGVLAIKVIQEQQKIINSLQSTVSSQEAKIETQDKKYRALLERVIKLENN